MSRAQREPSTLPWRKWLTDRAAEVGDRGALHALIAGLCGGSEVCPVELPPSLPEGFTAPDVVAAAREWLLARERRRSAGAVYTPPAIAAGVLAQAVGGWSVPPSSLVCDPACGGGVFLLAAARWLHRCGVAPEVVVRDLLWGADIDELAVECAAGALALWSQAVTGEANGAAAGHVAVGDPLVDGVDAWSALGDEGGFDLVVGNPPFQGQLARETARSRHRAAALAGRLGSSVGGYADTSALFLVAGRHMVRAGGRLSLVLPESVLAARDATAARGAALDGARLVGLWVATESVFEAGTKVCAPVLEVGSGSSTVQRTRGRIFERLAPARIDGDELSSGGSWSRLALAAYGTPELPPLDGHGVLGDVATATAGFRQQFYGLAPHVLEGSSEDVVGSKFVPLVTSGLVDVGEHRWGRRPARFAGRTWTRPVVDLDALAAADPRLERWVRARLVPKVLVASQTKVIEAVADPEGRLVPSVPVVSVESSGDALWLVAAALLGPVASAWALAHAGGAGLAADTIKLSATQLLRVPLPADVDRWREGAELLRLAHVQMLTPDWARFGALLVGAYGLPVGGAVLDWWLGRLPEEGDNRG